MCTYIKFYMDPQDFPLGANLYQKLATLAILGSVSPHFLDHKSEIRRERADVELPSSGQITACTVVQAVV